MNIVLYHIQLSYATAGIVVKNGKITKTAPIFKWMRGRDIEFVKKWVKKKNGKIIEVKCPYLKSNQF